MNATQGSDGARSPGSGPLPWLLLLSTLLFPIASANAQQQAQSPTPDIFLLAGWQVFHQNCHTCHGVDATGTDVAPNLVESIKELTADQFSTKVLTRYRILVPASEAGADDRTALREAIMEEVRKHERGKAGELVMPAWQGSPVVRPHLLDLYDYLRARAAGTLGPGKPPSPPSADPGDRNSMITPLPGLPAQHDDARAAIGDAR